MAERDPSPNDALEQARNPQERLAAQCDEYIAETMEDNEYGHGHREVTFLNNGKVIETHSGSVTNWNRELKVTRQDRSFLLFGRRIKPKTTYTLRESKDSISGWAPDNSSQESFSFTTGSYDPKKKESYEEFGEKLHGWLQFYRERKAE